MKQRVAQPNGKPSLGRRLWRFVASAIAIVLAVTLLVLLLETGLRVSGFGYPTSFLIGREVNGESILVNNPKFPLRFFPPALVRHGEPIRLRPSKGENTYRIFLFGGSAAYGIPDPAFSFSRILEVMLEDAVPGLNVEMINVAASATNSHVARVVAEECASLDPDLYLVFSGNNEVIGPYGAGTVFTGFFTSYWQVRGDVFLQSTRIMQLADFIRSALGIESQAPTHWGGHAMFKKSTVAARDPRLETVYVNFGRNLEDIAKTGLRSGAAVALCTVPVNLRDWSPFASGHDPELEAAARATWNQNFEQGKRFQDSGKYAEALESYQDAMALYPRHAELLYRLGLVCEELNRYEQAQGFFAQARGLDILRFRADSRINDRVRDTAQLLNRAEVVMIDIEQAFAKQSAHGTPGDNLFFDHCHMNFDGNWLAAATVFRGLIPLLSQSLENAPSPDAAPLHQATCAKRLGYTPLDRKANLQYMLQACKGPPFSDRFDHDNWLASMRERLAISERDLMTENLEVHVASMEQALVLDGDNPFLHRNLAKLYKHLGNHESAAKHWRRVLSLVPDHVQALTELARAQRETGDNAAAIEQFRAVLDLRPDYPDVHWELAGLLEQTGEVGQAIEHHRRFVILRPAVGYGYWGLGRALQASGDDEAALAAFRKGTEEASNSKGLHYSIAQILEKRSDLDGAIQAYQHETVISPDDGNVYGLLAELLWREKSIDAARKALEACIEHGGVAPKGLAEKLRM